MATIKIRWTVNELVNVMSQFDVQKVYRATSQAGTYAEITDAGTRVAFVTDQTSYFYDDLSGATTYWYKVSYYNSATLAESTLSDAIPATGGGNYLSLQDVRDAGFTEAAYSDARVLQAITDAEAFLEAQTGRWFYPKQMSIRVDGNGSRLLPIQTPIIEVSEIRVWSSWAEFGTTQDVVQLESVRITNRHLTHGMLRPDDRDAPCLTFEVFEAQPTGRLGRYPTAFYEGTHNVEITGWFGHTELAPGVAAGETAPGSQVPLSRGVTPVLATRAALLLMARYLTNLASGAEAMAALREWAVIKYKTRDQEIQYSKDAVRVGGITGDAEVDMFLGMFAEPMEMAFV